MKDESDNHTIDILQNELSFMEWCEGLEDNEEAEESNDILPNPVKQQP